MGILIFFSIFIISLLYFQLTKRISKEPMRQLPPGPKPLPFFGSILSMLLNKPVFRWIHRLMDEANTKIICIRLGRVHVVVVSDPEIACEFLKNKDMEFLSRPDCMSGYLSSNGYLTTVLAPMADDRWKKMRKMIEVEILSPARHKWFEHKRDEEADNLLRYIYNQCNNASVGGVINVRIAVQQYCGNVARKMFFGTRYFDRGREEDGPGKEEMDHITNIFKVLSYIYTFCVTDYLPWLRWVMDFDGHEKNIRKAIRHVRQYQDPLVDQRVQEWKDGVRSTQNDFLDVLINHENPRLTIDEIKAQILELNLAMVDNQSSVVEWAMAEILNEPRILKKAVDELDRVVGKDRLIQESDLVNLNYIKACAREAFRLHPVAPFNLPHVSTSDTIVAGYFIPKGSHVLLSRLGLGRNSDTWDDPLRFNPDRHMTNNSVVVLTDHKLRMLSFSTGRRGCPGVLLGSTMIVMLLGRLLQGFTWEVPDGKPYVDLTESYHDLYKAMPLFAFVKSRLPNNLYPI